MKSLLLLTLVGSLAACSAAEVESETADSNFISFSWLNTVEAREVELLAGTKQTDKGIWVQVKPVEFALSESQTAVAFNLPPSEDTVEIMSTFVEAARTGRVDANSDNNIAVCAKSGWRGWKCSTSGRFASIDQDGPITKVVIATQKAIDTKGEESGNTSVLFKTRLTIRETSK